MLLLLPLELICTVLEDWLCLHEWVRLDSAVGSVTDRMLFRDALKMSQLQHEVQLENNVDQVLVWLAKRVIRVRKLLLVDTQCRATALGTHSLTTQSIVELTYQLREDYLLQLLPLCSNVQKLCMPSTSNVNEHQLNKWCPKLTELQITRNGWFEYNNGYYLFESLTMLERMHLIGLFYSKKIALPPQLEVFVFNGYVCESVLLHALQPCTQLKTVKLAGLLRYEGFNWRSVLGVLPSSITSLEFSRCRELDYVLNRFTQLTDLFVSGCDNLTSFQFDRVFGLPRLQNLSLWSADDLCILEDLDTTIVCPTLQELDLYKISLDYSIIAARCPNLKEPFDF